MPTDVTIAARFSDISGQGGAKWCVAARPPTRDVGGTTKIREGIEPKERECYASHLDLKIATRKNKLRRKKAPCVTHGAAGTRDT
jgi:hypothetical protein